MFFLLMRLPLLEESSATSKSSCGITTRQHTCSEAGHLQKRRMSGKRHLGSQLEQVAFGRRPCWCCWGSVSAIAAAAMIENIARVRGVEKWRYRRCEGFERVSVLEYELCKLAVGRVMSVSDAVMSNKRSCMGESNVRVLLMGYNMSVVDLVHDNQEDSGYMESGSRRRTRTRRERSATNWPPRPVANDGVRVTFCLCRSLNLGYHCISSFSYTN
jgi:hypothetical protein